jgi:lipopolysaccharide/colanic/teichoic acid biosynthesis glycosyltransferase
MTTNNDLQSTTQKTKDRATPDPLTRRRTDNTMAKRMFVLLLLDIVLSVFLLLAIVLSVLLLLDIVLRKTDNTMAKRRRTDHTMANRRKTENTMSKRKGTKGQEFYPLYCLFFFF